MSAGTKEAFIYESRSGEKHYVLQDSDSAILSLDGSPNTIPTGPATSPFWARASLGAKEFGLKPRTVTIKWVGPPPAGYVQYGKLERVIYSPDVFDGVSIGDPVTLLGANGKITQKKEESYFPGI